MARSRPRKNLGELVDLAKTVRESSVINSRTMGVQGPMMGGATFMDATDIFNIYGSGGEYAKEIQNAQKEMLEILADKKNLSIFGQRMMRSSYRVRANEKAKS
jgi:hypothetical protein